MAMANTLAYYNAAAIRAVKSFIVQDPGGVMTSSLTTLCMKARFVIMSVIKLNVVLLRVVAPAST
jgi:hypothetical protein